MLCYTFCDLISEIKYLDDFQTLHEHIPHISKDDLKNRIVGKAIDLGVEFEVSTFLKHEASTKLLHRVYHVLRGEAEEKDDHSLFPAIAKRLEKENDFRKKVPKDVLVKFLKRQLNRSSHHATHRVKLHELKERLSELEGFSVPLSVLSDVGERVPQDWVEEANERLRETEDEGWDSDYEAEFSTEKERTKIAATDPSNQHSAQNKTDPSNQHSSQNDEQNETDPNWQAGFEVGQAVLATEWKKVHKATLFPASQTNIDFFLFQGSPSISPPHHILPSKDKKDDFSFASNIANLFDHETIFESDHPLILLMTLLPLLSIDSESRWMEVGRALTNILPSPFSLHVWAELTAQDIFKRTRGHDFVLPFLFSSLYSASISYLAFSTCDFLATVQTDPFLSRLFSGIASNIPKQENSNFLQTNLAFHAFRKGYQKALSSKDSSNEKEYKERLNRSIEHMKEKYPHLPFEVIQDAAQKAMESSQTHTSTWSRDHETNVALNFAFETEDKTKDKTEAAETFNKTEAAKTFNKTEAAETFTEIQSVLDALHATAFKKCKDAFHGVITNEVPRVSLKTIATFAREDSPSAFAGWFVHWTNAPLVRFLCEKGEEKDKKGEKGEKGRGGGAKIDDVLSQVAIRSLWLDYLCVSAGTNNVNWYSMEKNSISSDCSDTHSLSQATGSLCLIRDLHRLFGKTIDVAKKVLGKKCEYELDPRISEHMGREMRKLSSIQTALCNELTYEKIIRKMKASSFFHPISAFPLLENDNPCTVAFRNGVLETTGTEISFRRGKVEDFITKNTNFDVPLDLSDTHPDVVFLMDYLKQVFPFPELLEFELINFASFFYGRNNDKLFRVWTGVGNNSKSILIKILQKIFGNDYAVNVPMEAFCVRGNKGSGSNAPSPEFAQADGARLVFTTEPADHLKLSAGIIKRHTGGDAQYFRKLYENGKSQVMTYKVVVGCNLIPNITDFDDAIKARYQITPFVGKWVERPTKEFEYLIDTDFERHVPRLAKALLWKMIQYFPKYKAVGVKNQPEIVKEHVMNYWMEKDFYLRFANERVVRDVGHNLKLPVAFAAFKNWFTASIDGQKPPDLTTFRTNMIKDDKLGALAPSTGAWKDRRLMEDGEECQ